MKVLIHMVQAFTIVIIHCPSRLAAHRSPRTWSPRGSAFARSWSLRLSRWTSSCRARPTKSTRVLPSRWWRNVGIHKIHDTHNLWKPTTNIQFCVVMYMLFSGGRMVVWRMRRQSTATWRVTTWSSAPWLRLSWTHIQYGCKCVLHIGRRFLQLMSDHELWGLHRRTPGRRSRSKRSSRPYDLRRLWTKPVNMNVPKSVWLNNK